MAGVCEQFKAPANIGTHKLHVTLPQTNATVTADHMINGVVVHTWEQQDLSPPPSFGVQKGENHRINVRATFTGAATVIAVVKLGDVDQVPPCTLTQDGSTTAGFTLIA